MTNHTRHPHDRQASRLQHTMGRSQGTGKTHGRQRSVDNKSAMTNHTRHPHDRQASRLQHTMGRSQGSEGKSDAGQRTAPTKGRGCPPFVTHQSAPQSGDNQGREMGREGGREEGNKGPKPRINYKSRKRSTTGGGGVTCRRWVGYQKHGCMNKNPTRTPGTMRSVAATVFPSGFSFM